METGIGDRLARGNASAQFPGASSGITDFENDFIYHTKDEICTKYGLSEAEYDTYQALRDVQGEHLPDLTPVALQEAEPELGSGFSIKDHRQNYLLTETDPKDKAEVAPKKFPEPTFDLFTPVLDRLLIMRVADDPDTLLLEDGSTKNLKSGLITAAKYRQHSNVGIVLAMGQCVYLSGVRCSMTDFVNVGDKVTYGDYNSEVFPMDDKKVEALCDSLSINYVKDEQGLRIVRIQDIRGVERRVVEGNWASIGTGAIKSVPGIFTTPVINYPSENLGTGGSNV
jgi:co-chaperonin GroES (HSP10)